MNKVNSLIEAIAIRDSQNNLYKKLGLKKKAKIKRTRSMQFEIL